MNQTAGLLFYSLVISLYSPETHPTWLPMLAVRPCAKDNPNAICWATENGKSRMVSASAFCRILFSILDWDSEYDVEDTELAPAA